MRRGEKLDVGLKHRLPLCVSLRDATRLLFQLTSRSLRSPPRDYCSYNSLISAAGKNGEDARKAFEMIRTKGLRPDLISYNTVMGAVAGNKKEVRAGKKITLTAKR